MGSTPDPKRHSLYLLWNSDQWAIYDKDTVPNLVDVPSANYFEYKVLPGQAGKVYDLRDKYNHHKYYYNPGKRARKKLFPSLEKLLG